MSDARPRAGTAFRRNAAAPAEGAVRGPIPARQPPQLATLVAEAPPGLEWATEIKFDGYRLLPAVEGGRVRLLTRSGLDWADRLPAVAQAVAALPVRAAMLDCELVSISEDGATSFPGLQAALSAGRDETLHLYVFDLLHLDGWDLRPCRLLERKRVLENLAVWSGTIRYSSHHLGQAVELHARACALGLEGVVAKQADAPYRAGRSSRWVKVKCLGREEFVVLGWSPPGGSRVGIGSLHVGYYDPQGNLHYAGGVGTGFSDRELASWRARLDGMEAKPPGNLLYAGDPIDRAVTWVRPELVVEVSYTDWSGAGRIRHPVYLGAREDKAALEVVREPADPEAVRTAIKVSGSRAGSRKGWHGAVPPLRKSR